MSYLTVGLLIAGVVFGAIGVWIAERNGASSTAGFLFGAFLGPFGLIIVALLGPRPMSGPRPSFSRAELRGPADLTNDSYKLWLASEYQIRKHEGLGAYVCESELFDSTEEALARAHQLEGAKRAAQRQSDELRSIEEATREEERKHQHIKRRAALRAWTPYLLVAIAIVAVGTGYWLVSAKREAHLQAELERQARTLDEERARSSAVAERGAAHRELVKWGLDLYPDAAVVDIRDITVGNSLEIHCSFESDGETVKPKVSEITFLSEHDESELQRFYKQKAASANYVMQYEGDVGLYRVARYARKEFGGFRVETESLYSESRFNTKVWICLTNLAPVPSKSI